MVDRDITATPWLDMTEMSRRLAECFVRSRTRSKGAQQLGENSYIVGVIGSAGLGKTETCTNIVQKLQNGRRSAVRVPLDSFLYTRAERESFKVCGYESGDWRVTLAEAKLHELLILERSIEIESYRAGGEHGDPVRVSPAEFILLDGNYAVLGGVRRLLTLLIAFTADLETMRALRFKRDTQPERGRSPQEAEEVWVKELPALKANILPELAHADIVVEVREDLRRRVICRGRKTRHLKRTAGAAA